MQRAIHDTLRLITPATHTHTHTLVHIFAFRNDLLGLSCKSYGLCKSICVSIILLCFWFEWTPFEVDEVCGSNNICLQITSFTMALQAMQYVGGSK